MRISPTLTILFVACALFVLSPYFPSWLLQMTVGTTIGSAFLLVLVLIVLQDDIVLGLATFMAVSALFLENRRRTVEKVTKALTPDKAPFEFKDLDKNAPDLVPGEKHPSPKEADVEDHGYEPEEQSGTNKFENVGESQDEKHPLDTVPPKPSEVSEFLQEKGLAHI